MSGNSYERERLTRACDRLREIFLLAKRRVVLKREYQKDVSKESRQGTDNGAVQVALPTRGGTQQLGAGSGRVGAESRASVY